jgi:hypothetical protein
MSSDRSFAPEICRERHAIVSFALAEYLELIAKWAQRIVLDSGPFNSVVPGHYHRQLRFVRRIPPLSGNSPETRPDTSPVNQ